MSTEFRGIAMFGFFTCAPMESVSEFLYDHLFAPYVEALPNGEAKYAQYGLRKVEASLLREFRRDEVIVGHPEYMEKLIGPKTEVVGLNVMDPLGIGPVTTSFAFGTWVTPFNRVKFRKFVDRINRIRRENGYKFKLVVGGGGAWQLLDERKREELGIDHVVLGEADADAPRAFREIMDGSAKEVIRMKPPRVEEIPDIVKPSINSLVEVMRGCGRNCRFCDPNTRRARYMPLDKIKREAMVNLRGGHKSVWMHSEDVLLYMLEDRKNFYPNRDAVVELYREVGSLPGVEKFGATHLSLSAVAADEELIPKLSKILGTRPDRWVGVQPGIETGSPELLKRHMANKVKPFSVYEWPDVVREAIRILNENYWEAVSTLIVGLPGETPEDTQETIELVKTLDDTHSVLAPLFFVPMGELRDQKYFTVDFITEKQWELIYVTWKHNLKEYNYGVMKATQHLNFIMRAILWLLTKWGSRVILNFLRDFGKKHFGIYLD